LKILSKPATDLNMDFLDYLRLEAVRLYLQVIVTQRQAYKLISPGCVGLGNTPHGDGLTARSNLGSLHDGPTLVYSLSFD
jgi:hypothetical protein